MVGGSCARYLVRTITIMKNWLVAGLLLLACLPLRAQLDATFSGDGKVNANIGSFPTTGSDMLIQPDQNILVAGYYYDGSSVGIGLALMRFTTVGTLDPNFGSGGKVSFIFPNRIAGVIKVGVQSTKNIVVLAAFQTGNTSSEPVLFRFTPNGSPDLTFSPTGYKILSSLVEATAIAIQTDDKILVGGGGGPGLGVNIYRYSPDGVLDTQFGNNGLATVAGAGITAMTIGSGRIVTVGHGVGGNWTQVSCFSSAGFPDANFGHGGVTPVNVNGNDETFLNGVFVTPDDFVLAVGLFIPAGTNTVQRFLIVRLRPDGLLDPSFAGNGKLGVPFPSSASFGESILQDWQGFIYAAGAVDPFGGKEKFGICRVTVNGVLDTRFGTNGLFTFGWSGQDAGALAIAQQSNGKLVVAGDADADGFAVARLNNPFVPPPPPVVTALDSSAVVGNRAVFGSAAGVVKLFPNPVTSMLRVQGLNAQGSTVLLVRDAGGKTLMSVKVEQQSEYSLDVHRLTAGTYFLELITGGRQAIFPFVKAP